MSFLDRAKQLVDQHDEQVDQALDHAGDAAKQRFAGHDSHIDSAVDQAQQRTGAGDTTAPAPGSPSEPEPGFRPDGTGHQVGYAAEGDYPPPDDSPQPSAHEPLPPAPRP